MLMQVGHPLDFDWKAAQKGKGRNSDVDTVGVLRLRASAFGEELRDGERGL